MVSRFWHAGRTTLLRAFYRIGKWPLRNSSPVSRLVLLLAMLALLAVAVSGCVELKTYG